MVDWRWRAERGVPFNPAPLLDATPMLTRGSGMLGEKETSERGSGSTEGRTNHQLEVQRIRADSNWVLGQTAYE